MIVIPFAMVWHGRLCTGIVDKATRPGNETRKVVIAHGDTASVTSGRRVLAREGSVGRGLLFAGRSGTAGSRKGGNRASALAQMKASWSCQERAHQGSGLDFHGRLCALLVRPRGNRDIRGD